MNTYDVEKKLNYLERAYRDICCKVKSCLGIKSNGDENKFLNQKGQWETVSGSSEIIEITKAELLALISSNSVQNATYKITDIEDFNDVYVIGLENSNISLSGTATLFVPKYEESGLYKGQYHPELGAIADGDIYTWGIWNWKNISGSPITPDLPSDNVIDSGLGFTRLPKNTNNHYNFVEVSIKIDENLNIISVENVRKSNSTQFSDLKKIAPETALAALAQLFLVDSSGENDTCTCYGNKNIILINNRITSSGGGDNFGIGNNSGSNYPSIISNSYINDFGITENIGIYSNNLFSTGLIDNIVGTIRLAECHIVGGGSEIKNIKSVNGGYIDILHCEINDNSRLKDWIFTGTGGRFFVWDNCLHENINFLNFDIQFNSGDYGFNNGHYNHGFKIDGYVFTQSDAILNYGEAYTQFNFAQNINIENIQDVTFSNCEFSFPYLSLYNADLTGFSQKILNQSIIGNKGSFVIEHDFNIEPLTNGNTLLYNWLPQGAVITSIIAKGNGLSGGAGALLQLGMSVDANNLIGADVLSAYNTGKTYTGFSTPSTGNRSLNITASMEDITTGKLIVKVDFIL